MMQMFLINYHQKFTRQRDWVVHNLWVSHYNSINVKTKLLIIYINSELNNQIIDCGLKLFVNQLKYIRDEITHNQTYTDQFKTIYSISCYYIICKLKVIKITIKKSHFHAHWYFKHDQFISFSQSSDSTVFSSHKVITHSWSHKNHFIKHN